MKRGLIVVLIIVWSLTVTVAQEFRILFTGNVHGALTEFDTDIGQKRGGAAVRKTVIDRAISGLARDKYMLLDAGGFTGCSLPSLFSGGKTDVLLYNEFNYDAVGLATTEFMRSSKELNALAKAAKFYFLNANVKVGNKNIAENYYTKTFDGVKVAVISLVREDLATALTSAQKREYNLNTVLTQADETIKELEKKEKPSIIIIMGNFGTSASQAISQVVKGVDIIIDTANPDMQLKKIKSTNIIGFPSEGDALLELNIKASKKGISSIDALFHDFNANITPDPKVESFVEKHKTIKGLEKKIAHLKRGTLSSKDSMQKLTTLGTLFTEALLFVTESEVSFLNSSFFAEAELAENSKIDYTTFEKACRYSNNAVLLKLNGATLKKAIEYSMGARGYGNFLQFSGMEVEYDEKQKEVTAIRVGGQALVDRKEYKVVTSNYLANGGDGYDFADAADTIVDIKLPILYIVKERLESLKNINSIEPSALKIK